MDRICYVQRWVLGKVILQYVTLAFWFVIRIFLHLPCFCLWGVGDFFRVLVSVDCMTWMFVSRSAPRVKIAAHEADGHPLVVFGGVRHLMWKICVF